MDQRVVIEQLSVSNDDIGFPSESWSTLATVWAEVRQEKGAEIVKANRPVATEYIIVFMRYRSDVTAKNRLSWSSRTWDIENVRVIDSMKRNDGLEITARAHD